MDTFWAIKRNWVGGYFPPVLNYNINTSLISLIRLAFSLFISSLFSHPSPYLATSCWDVPKLVTLQRTGSLPLPTTTVVSPFLDCMSTSPWSTSINKAHVREEKEEERDRGMYKWRRKRVSFHGQGGTSTGHPRVTMLDYIKWWFDICLVSKLIKAHKSYLFLIIVLWRWFCWNIKKFHTIGMENLRSLVKERKWISTGEGSAAFTIGMDADMVSWT